MTQKLIRVTGPASAAVAILTQHNDTWAVTHTAPSLAWMRGLGMPAIKQRLTDDGATWEWLPVSEQFAAIAAQTPQNAAKRAARAKRSSSTTTAAIVESAPSSAHADADLELWLKGCANAVKAEARKQAIVRNVRTRRKEKVTDNG